jgi:hypothetical protein
MDQIAGFVFLLMKRWRVAFRGPLRTVIVTAAIGQLYADGYRSWRALSIRFLRSPAPTPTNPTNS